MSPAGAPAAAAPAIRSSSSSGSNDASLSPLLLPFRPSSWRRRLAVSAVIETRNEGGRFCRHHPVVFVDWLGDTKKRSHFYYTICRFIRLRL